MKKTKTNTKTNIQSITIPKCHNGPVEIFPGLLLGSEREAIDMKTNIIVALASLEPEIWKKGWRGEIWYYPTRDYSTLPLDVQSALVSRILSALNKGKTVGICCLGGHGRTGYVAALVLGKLGIEDPIDHLRKNYCSKAVESKEQIEAIAKFLKKPDLKKHEPIPLLGWLKKTSPKTDTTCGTCLFAEPAFGNRSFCWVLNNYVHQEDSACPYYNEEGGELNVDL